MAFTTGPDFLSGILGASNSTDVLNKFKSDTGQEDFYQGLRNRYGERIGDDGYLDGGVGTYDFIDSDRDGIDDRHQAGPGQPKAGSNPDGNPIFGGGNLPPNAGGGDNPNSPMNNRPVADYNPNLVGQYVGYNNPEYGMGLTYNNSSNVDPAVEPTGILKNILPGALFARTLGKGIDFFEEKFFPEALKNNVDKLIPEAIKESYGDLMDYGTEDEDEDAIDYGLRARELGLLGPTSYETNQAAATENSLANIAYKDEVNALAEVDPALRKRLTSFGEDLSISDYNTALSEFTPTENFPSLTTTNPLAAYQQAQKESQAEREAREAQAEQDRINNAVASGNYVGTGFDPVTGNYGGLLTNTNSNSGTSVTSNVQTGPYSGAALSGAIQNENFNNTMANARQKNLQDKLDAATARKEKDKKGGGSGAGSGAGSGGCFVEGTPIQMADGTTKEITTINVGEETKGGVVQAKMEFMPQNIYNYKDVLVSGSHWVVEDNQLVAVEDSKHGVLTDRVEPVYTFKTSNNRIWIYDIEFGDFETGSDADWEPHFEAVRQKLNKELSEKTT